MIELILQLEDKNEFEIALTAYQNLFLKNKIDFEVWKHFFFFLWISIEDVPKEFQEKIDRRIELEKMLIEGKNNFSELAEFNFLAGYCISIFPYEFGNFEDLERQGAEMLLTATQIEPENIIYKMVYLGNLPNVDRKEYEEAVISARPIVNEKYNGIGFLNKYFIHVLSRKV